MIDGARSVPLLLLMNPNARNGVAGEEVRREITDAGLNAIYFTPKDKGEANALIRSHGADISAVVVGGGDGTISAALPALTELGLPLGILPLGSANDFARTLGIPENTKEAVATIARGNVRTVDVSDVNGNLFVNSATIGLPCEITADITHGAKKALGPLASLTLLPRVWHYARPFHASLQYGGVTKVVVTNAMVVGNGRYEGGFPVKYERVDDGLLNVTISTTRNLFETLAAVFFELRKTSPHHNRVLRFDTNELSIGTPVPRRISADGELVSMTPATFKVHRRALSVFANPV